MHHVTQPWVYMCPTILSPYFPLLLTPVPTGCPQNTASRCSASLIELALLLLLKPDFQGISVGESIFPLLFKE